MMVINLFISYSFYDMLNVATYQVEVEEMKYLGLGGIYLPKSPLVKYLFGFFGIIHANKEQ